MHALLDFLNRLVISVSVTIRTHAFLTPSTPTIVGIIWQKGIPHMVALGTVDMSPAAPDVTKRVVTVVWSGGNSTDYDVTAPGATIAANEGDAGTATLVDTNAVGSSQPSAPFAFTVTIAGGGVPATPEIRGIDWKAA